MAQVPLTDPNQPQKPPPPAPVSWTALPRRLLIYIAIVVIGTTLIHFVFVNSTLDFVSTLIPATTTIGQAAHNVVQSVRQSAYQAGIGGLILSNVGVVLTGIVTMLVLVVITHLIVTLILRGKGTIPNQTAALLHVYNRWLPVEYVLLVIGALLAWSALPQSLCLFVPGVIVALYVGAKVPAQIGTAYDVSPRRGCIAYIGAIIIFSLITGGLFYVLAKALIFAINVHNGG